MHTTSLQLYIRYPSQPSPAQFSLHCDEGSHPSPEAGLRWLESLAIPYKLNTVKREMPVHCIMLSDTCHAHALLSGDPGHPIGRH